MVILKKLIFALPFLVFLLFTLLFFRNSFIDPNQILSLDLKSIFDILIFNSLLILTALFFCVSVSFARDWKLVLPIILVSLISIFVIFPVLNSPAIFLVVGFLITETIIFLFLDNHLKTYLTFSPTQIYTPFIKRFTHLAILSFSVTLFIFFTNFYQTNKFEIPDSLIDTALKTVPKSITAEVPGSSLVVPSQLSISPEQTELLKQNPQLLERFGLTASQIDLLTKSTTVLTESAEKQIPLEQVLIKQAVKYQLNQIINPYTQFIPLALAGLFFLTAYSFSSILLILVSPILWMIFKILEKTKFITFTKEMREVKKMTI